MVKVSGHTWQIAPQTNPAVIAASFYERPSGDNTLRRVVHPHWVIDYGTEPGSLYRVNRAMRRWQPREPHRFHLYAPETVYWEDYSQVPHTSWQGGYIIFRGGTELNLQHLVEPGRGHAVIADPTEALRPMLIQAAEAGQRHGENGFLEVQSILWQIAALLQSCRPIGDYHYHIAPPAPESTESTIVTAVDDYLQTHLAQRVTLDTIARHLHLSPSALSHRYKAGKGRSPIASLIAMRIQVTKALLLKGYSLKAIAPQTGFTDAFHLSRAFKQDQGISPRDFLRQTSQVGSSENPL